MCVCVTKTLVPSDLRTKHPLMVRFFFFFEAVSIDLGVTKMNRTCRLKFRAKSLHVTLMLIAVVLKPGQLRTDRVTISCDDQSVSAGGANGLPQGDVLGPQTFCLFLSHPVSRLVFFLKVCLLACLLAVGRTGRQHPTSLSEHWRPGLMSSRRDIWEPLQVDCSLECLIDTMGWAPRQLLLFSAAAQ